MDRLSEARRWLSEAEWDLGTAKDLLELGRYNAAAFYAQQAAEKAVKAMLYALGEVPIGHSVRELLERFASLSGQDVGSLMDSARELDRHFRQGILMPYRAEHRTKPMMNPRLGGL